MLSEDEKEAIKKVEEIKNMKFIITSSFYSRGAISLSIVEKEAIDIVLNLIEKLKKENEVLKKQEKRTVIFIDSQIRCFDRKIKNILSIKKERRLSERERRTIKYLVGKKDECEKIKSKINKLKEN